MEQGDAGRLCLAPSPEHSHLLTLEICQRLPQLLEHHGLLLQFLHWDEPVVVGQILLYLLH